MKRLLLIIACLCGLHSLAWADIEGLPFYNHYKANQYHAHNRNFSIATDKTGTIYVANFEGLLYYDGSLWRIIHTDNFSRITCVAYDEKDNRIWVGGYNVFGYLEADTFGRLRLHSIISDTGNSDFSEVDKIKPTAKRVYVHTINGTSFYTTDDNHLQELTSGNDQIFSSDEDSLHLPTLSARVESLVSSTINGTAFDGKSMLWLATNKDIYSEEIVAPYSFIDEKVNLIGEVKSIAELGGYVYVGTMEGLYRLRGTQIQHVEGIDFACWQLLPISEDNLLVATSDGLFSLTAKGVRRLTSSYTLSVCQLSDGNFITGEIDGIYSLNAQNSKHLLYSLEKATSIKTQLGEIFAENITGQLWSINIDGSHPHCIRQHKDPKEPAVSYTDTQGNLWATDPVGKQVTLCGDSVTNAGINYWLNAYSHSQVNVIYRTSDNKLLLGGEFGIYSLDLNFIKGRSIFSPEAPLIRQITAMRDSVVWGGFSPEDLKPKTTITGLEFPSSCHNVTVYFSTRNRTNLGATLYRYRVNNGRWSSWSEEAYARFDNISWGRTKLDIQAQSVNGQESELSHVEWKISYPFYLSWYANLLYMIVLISIIRLLLSHRTARLANEKKQLEKIVAERTAALATTIDDLKQTQSALVRMERTAAVGKLTQGLIDRILNPLNYINNFSKLTANLTNDLKSDVEDEKENMGNDTYDDCLDIIDMMDQNLQKIQEHGMSTTRTLRAMESVLNMHVGTLQPTDVTPLVRQVANVTNEKLKGKSDDFKIEVRTEMPSKSIYLDIDASVTDRVLHTMLANSIYYLRKKNATTPFSPELVIRVEEKDKEVDITIHDNGCGIESSILDKVFDPFFTTKPTGEASGVGLYLCREMIQEENGTIRVETIKDQYCNFIITLPKANDSKASDNGQ